MESIGDRWRAWVEPHGDDPPLDDALYEVAVDEGCTEPREQVLGALDELAHGLPPDPDPERALARLLHRMFTDRGFRGDTEDYDHPRNSRLDLVLKRRRGLPILLSSVLVEVGRRAGVALDGVGLPGHFLVRTRRGPVVFLDPFHGGRIWSEQELEGQLGDLDPDHALAPTPTRDLLVRVSTNLMGSWMRRDEPIRALANAERRVALRPDVPELVRDQGLLRARVGDVHGAAFDLATYLEARPAAPDASRIRWMVCSLPLGLG